MFDLCEGYSHNPSRDGYIDALDEAYAELDEEYPNLEEWLKENMSGKFEIVDDYEGGGGGILCYLSIKFELDTDAVAFKLKWV